MDGERYFLLNIGGGAQFFESPAPPQGAGEREILTDKGRYAIREDPAEVALRDPDSKQGATQSWADAVAAMAAQK
jgi:hypothetical protein